MIPVVQAPVPHSFSVSEPARHIPRGGQGGTTPLVSQGPVPYVLNEISALTNVHLRPKMPNNPDVSIKQNEGKWTASLGRRPSKS